MQGRTATSPRTLVAVVVAFLLPVAYSPSTFATFWTPKAATVLVGAMVGLALLPQLLRRADRRTVLPALGFLGAAALATLVSAHPAGALFGLYNWGTGLIFVACLVGVWCLGLSVAADEALVRRSLLAGVALSCATAVLQSLVDLGLPALESGGRAVGLAGNPVHLATVALVGVALAVEHQGRLALAAVGVALFAMPVQLSGTRFGIVLLVALSVWAVIRQGRRGGLLALAIVVGVLLGQGVAEVGGTVQTATGRASPERTFTAGGGGAAVRLEVWWYARHAIAERPLLGHGPGRFRAATSADRSLEAAHAEGPGVIYSDGHNLVIEYLVGTGVVGLVLLLWWLTRAFAGAKGPMLLVAAVVLAMGLVQPQSVGTTPLAFLALGVAARQATIDPLRRLDRVLVGAGTILGVIAAGVLLIGDVSLERFRSTFDRQDGRRADAYLPPWPITTGVKARATIFRALDEPDHDQRAELIERALAWRREAVSRDPTDPALWHNLAGDELADGRITAALAHYREALRHDPFSLTALLGIARAADRQGDEATAVEAHDRAMELWPGHVSKPSSGE